MTAIRGLVIELAIMIAVGVSLAALGPFDSYQLGGFADRLAYWLPATLIGYAVFRPVSFAADWAARHLRLPRLAAIFGVVLIAAIPGAIAIAMIGGYSLAALPPFADLFGLYVNVVLVGTLVTLLFMLLERKPEAPLGRSDDRVLDAQPSEMPPAPRFLERLPPAWNGRLLALEMEDHYVRAHGPGGASLLILMRMRDAEVELAGLDGLRVHRSWWVARDGVVGRSRSGRSQRLRLAGGLEAPVARDRVAALNAARWPD